MPRRAIRRHPLGTVVFAALGPASKHTAVLTEQEKYGGHEQPEERARNNGLRETQSDSRELVGRLLPVGVNGGKVSPVDGELVLQSGGE